MYKKKALIWDSAHMEHSYTRPIIHTLGLRSQDPQKPLQAPHDCTKEPN